MKKLLVILLAFSLIVGLVACQSQKQAAAPADTWPEKEIRLIIPYKEGGGSHRTAMLAKKIIEEKKLLSKPIVVQCMPAANTVQGQEEVLKASPDGYTLLVHHNAMVNGYAIDQFNFTYTDFKVVSQLWRAPVVFAARTDAPYKTLSEWVEYVKQHPGELKLCWSGMGGNTHFNAFLLLKHAGFEAGKEVKPVITSGGAQSAQYLAGGMADVGLEMPSSFAEYVKAGQFRILGHSGSSVEKMFDTEVQPFKSQGVDYSYYIRLLIFAPKNTPDNVVKKLEDVFQKVCSDPEFIAANAEEMNSVEFLPSKEATEAFAGEAKNADSIGDEIKAQIAASKK